MTKPNLRGLVRLIGNSLSVVSLAFIIYKVSALNGIEFLRQAPLMTLVILGGLAVINVGLVLSLSLVLRWSLSFLSNDEIALRPCVAVYARSNFMKYIPGNVAHLLGRNLLATEQQWKQTDVAMTTVFEIIMSLIVAGTLSALLTFHRRFEIIAALNEHFTLQKLIFVAVVGVCLGLGVGLYFTIARRALLQSFLRVFETKVTSFRFVRLFIKSYVLIGAQFILSGLLFAALFRILFGNSVDSSNLPLLVGVFIAGWTIGFVIPGAPGGLGVREYAYYLLLVPIFPAEQVLQVALVYRVICIVSDALAWAVGISLA